MPPFNYVAVAPNNERVTGAIEAPDRLSAAKEIAKRDLLVLKVEPQTRLRALWAFLNSDIGSHSNFSDKETSSLLGDWGSLLEAGIPLNDALGIAETGARNKRMRKTIAAVRADVSQGGTLHDALQRQDRKPVPGVLALIKAAEEAGNTGPTLTRISAELETKRQFDAELRNALLYPSFLAITSIICIAVLLVVVVPNIEILLENTSQNRIPAVTKIVISISRFLQAYGLAFVAAVVISCAAVFWALRLDRGKLILDQSLLKMPLLGPLLRLTETSRFLRALAELINGGVSLSKALPLATVAVRNKALQTRLAGAQYDVLRGASLTSALQKTECLSVDAIQVVRLGERTGKLTSLVGQAAVAYEQKSRAAFKTFATAIGPALTIAFGLVAGLIIYAVMTTILSLNELAFQ